MNMNLSTPGDSEGRGAWNAAVYGIAESYTVK